MSLSSGHRPTDPGTAWAVGTMWKAQDANSHPVYRRVGPVSGGILDPAEACPPGQEDGWLG